MHAGKHSEIISAYLPLASVDAFSFIFNPLSGLASVCLSFPCALMPKMWFIAPGGGSETDFHILMPSSAHRKRGLCCNAAGNKKSFPHGGIYYSFIDLKYLFLVFHRGTYANASEEEAYCLL